MGCIDCMYMDACLDMYGKRVDPLWAVGVDLVGPLDKEHYGLFDQDRHMFPSTVGR
jgi:hypothetical protein